MRLNLGPIALAALAACSSGQKTPATQPTPGTAFPAVSPATLKTDLYAFADDSMQGREAGTIGNVKGTTFIAAQAKKLGLEPAGENGTYFQVVPLVRKGLDPNSTLTAGGASLAMGKDWVSFGAMSQLGFAPTFTASNIGSVYAGRIGDSTVEPHRRTDRRQARGLPAADGEERPADVAVLAGPRPEEVRAAPPASPWWRSTSRRRRSSSSCRRPRNRMKGEDEGPKAGSPFAMLVSPAAAETILGANPASLAAGATGRPVSANITMLSSEVDTPARNVVAILPGSDPKLKSQYVAIGAHNDHIGLSDASAGRSRLHLGVQPRHAAGRRRERQPEADAGAEAKVQATLDSLRKVNKPRLDSINNGADDDGSGSVSVLAHCRRAGQEQGQAEALDPVRVAHRRGEGPLGLGVLHRPPHGAARLHRGAAQHRHGRPRQRDRRRPGRRQRQGGPNYLQLVGSRRLSTELGDLVEKVNVDGKYGFAFDYTLDANGHPANIYCRSDHANYARYGIPVVFFTTGVHQDYHQLTDEPQFINYDKMARIDTFIANVALAVANDDQRMVVDKPKPDPKAPCKQ